MVDGILNSVKRAPILVSISALLLVGLVLRINDAQSQQLSESVIVARCENAQAYLNKDLREKDLRARVDRVQAYEYVYQDLNMLALRLERNKQYSAKQMREQMTAFQQKISQLKVSYEKYDYSRDALAQLRDCTKNPQKFNELLTVMRRNRKEVEKQTIAIRTFLLANMSNQLEDTYDNFLKTSASGGLR